MNGGIKYYKDCVLGSKFEHQPFEKLIVDTLWLNK